MDDIKEPLLEAEPHDTAGDGASEAGGEDKLDRVFNRQKLLVSMTEKTGLPRGKALAVLEAVFEIMGHALKDGKEVRVLNFGSFAVSERKAGKGRDPRSGAEIDIPESKSVRFRASKALRDMVADTPI